MNLSSSQRSDRWRLQALAPPGLASKMYGVVAATILASAAHAQSAQIDQVGIPFCSGDGCPCGNESADSGCGNDGFDMDPSTGGLLSTGGTADVVADDLQVIASGLAPGATGILFMGEAWPSIRTGDGLLCIDAGATGLYRFPLQMADANGTITYDSVVSTSATLAMGMGEVIPGDTRAFQLFYRDAMGPCGNAFNATNAVAVTFEAAAPLQPIEREMGGRPIADYPFFERVDALNEGETLSLTLDGTPIAQQAGLNVDIYVVTAQTAAEWARYPTLVDARGASQNFTVLGGSAADAVVTLDTGDLHGTPVSGVFGDQIGRPYDLVIDVDRNGELGPGDIIDGGGDEPALIIARDTVAPGHHDVVELVHNGGSMRRQNIYYPADIENLGLLPLVIISHGNGHNFTWYDFLGEHLGSYGYVVMSHQNDTMPGIEAASFTTLDNTDQFLGNLDTIADGVLEGHIDTQAIAWVGHSRGAEGIARAYQRLTTGNFTPQHYGPSNIRFLSSMAPTVFLGHNLANPRGVPYHVWTGSADNDVNGAASSSGIVRSFVLHERADGERLVTALHGAGHGVFHDPGHGGPVAQGPCQLSYTEANEIIRAHFVHLFAHYLRGEPGAKDFLWRQYESFSPIGRPVSDCVTVNLELRDSPLAGNFVLDDMQTNPAVDMSSSGGAVTFTVDQLTENRLRDGNGSMAGGTADRFNGMSRVNGSLDDSRGITFRWNAPSFLDFEVPAVHRDLSGGRFLSFRATQLTREPNTVAALEDLTFEVTLTDGVGTASTINIGAYGGGIEEPYQRTGQGAGAGWSNEFETIRIRLTDFTLDGVALDLTDVTSVRFDFGTPGTSAVGAIGFDELQITAR